MNLSTSCFGHAKSLPPDVTPVSIARWPPRGWKGQRYAQLAPAADLLRAVKSGAITMREYARQYREQLAALDPAAVLKDLAAFGPAVAVLCFCSPDDCCHRRLVAEWFETSLGITVPEHGHADTPAFDALLDEVEPEETEFVPQEPVYEEYYFVKCDFCGRKQEVREGETEGLCSKCGKVFPIEWED